MFIRRRPRWPSVNDNPYHSFPLESAFPLSISTGLNGERCSSKRDYGRLFPSVQNLCHSITVLQTCRLYFFLKGRNNEYSSRSFFNSLACKSGSQYVLMSALIILNYKLSILIVTNYANSFQRERENSDMCSDTTLFLANFKM